MEARTHHQLIGVSRLACGAERISAGIEITDKNRNTVTATILAAFGEFVGDEIAGFDLALLKVSNPGAIQCAAEWDNGNGSRDAADSVSVLVVSRMNDDGRSTRTQLFPS